MVLPETQTEVKPDIVVLLQESTVNPTIYQFDKNVDLPDLFMFKKMKVSVPKAHYEYKPLVEELGFLSSQY